MAELAGVHATDSAGSEDFIKEVASSDSFDGKVEAAHREYVQHQEMRQEEQQPGAHPWSTHPLPSPSPSAQRQRAEDSFTARQAAAMAAAAAPASEDRPQDPAPDGEEAAVDGRVEYVPPERPAALAHPQLAAKLAHLLPPAAQGQQEADAQDGAAMGSQPALDQTAAALRIQAAHRGWQARRRVGAMRKQKAPAPPVETQPMAAAVQEVATAQQTAAALKIQAAHRGWQARRRVGGMRGKEAASARAAQRAAAAPADPCVERAAVCIQAAARGWRARRAVKAAARGGSGSASSACISSGPVTVPAAAGRPAAAQEPGEEEEGAAAPEAAPGADGACSAAGAEGVARVNWGNGSLPAAAAEAAPPGPPTEQLPREEEEEEGEEEWRVEGGQAARPATSAVRGSAFGLTAADCEAPPGYSGSLGLCLGPEASGVSSAEEGAYYAHEAGEWEPEPEGSQPEAAPQAEAAAAAAPAGAAAGGPAAGSGLVAAVPSVPRLQLPDIVAAGAAAPAAAEDGQPGLSAHGAAAAAAAAAGAGQGDGANVAAAASARHAAGTCCPGSAASTQRAGGALTCATRRRTPALPAGPPPTPQEAARSLAKVRLSACRQRLSGERQPAGTLPRFLCPHSRGSAGSSLASTMGALDATTGSQQLHASMGGAGGRPSSAMPFLSRTVTGERIGAAGSAPRPGTAAGGRRPGSAAAAGDAVWLRLSTPRQAYAQHERPATAAPGAGRRASWNDSIVVAAAGAAHRPGSAPRLPSPPHLTSGLGAVAAAAHGGGGMAAPLGGGSCLGGPVPGAGLPAYLQPLRAMVADANAASAQTGSTLRFALRAGGGALGHTRGEVRVEQTSGRLVSAAEGRGGMAPGSLGARLLTVAEFEVQYRRLTAKRGGAAAAAPPAMLGGHCPLPGGAKGGWSGGLASLHGAAGHFSLGVHDGDHHF